MKILFVALSLLFLLGCNMPNNNLSAPVQSELESQEQGLPAATGNSYEEYLLKEKYYISQMFETVHHFNHEMNFFHSPVPSGPSIPDSEIPKIYTHPAKIDAAYYGNSEAIFFLSEGEVYRLHIESKTLDLVYQNEELLSFRPLTNYRILIGLPNPENEGLRPFDPERKDDLFYIVNTKTGAEEPFFPEDFGYDGNILRSLNFVPPESIYTVPGEKIPEHKISEEPRIWQTQEAYLSAERYIKSNPIYYFINDQDPLNKTIYNKKRGEYYPIYKHDEQIASYWFDSGQIGYIKSGKTIYRLFLPDFTGEVFYQSDEKYWFAPLSTHAIMLMRENPEYVEENWDYNRENGIEPNRMFIYSSKTGEEQEIFREDLMMDSDCDDYFCPKAFYTIEE